MYCTGKSTVARITAAWLRTITTDIHADKNYPCYYFS